MKKTLSIILSIVLVISCISLLAGCGEKGETAEKTFKVGICNYVDDASLNQIVDNIQSELKSIAKANDVEFDVTVENCNADSSLLQQIIEEFKSDKVDLMIGVATPVAMAMQAQTANSDIPVVFSAVSDPISVGLVKSLENPEANITGTSDYLNTEAVLNLIKKLNPDVKKVGLLYDLGQDSSATPIKDAKKFLEDAGIKVAEANGATIEEIKLAAEQLVSEKVDAVFTPTDNSIMAAELSIYKIFADAKIPHYTGADSFALNGAFLGYGVDYANLGKETAKIVADILVNGKSPSSIPVKTFDNGIATINEETAKAIGYDFEKLSELFAPLCSKVLPIKTAESFDK